MFDHLNQAFIVYGKYTKQICCRQAVLDTLPIQTLRSIQFLNGTLGWCIKIQHDRDDVIYINSRYITTRWCIIIKLIKVKHKDCNMDTSVKFSVGSFTFVCQRDIS